MKKIKFHPITENVINVEVQIGGQWWSLEQREWLEFCKDVTTQIEAYIKKRAMDTACGCGSPVFYNDKVLGEVCCRCQAPR